MDRIKEAVRKRKLNRVNNKKLETEENDGDYDSLIMRELENGLEINHPLLEKKQKRDDKELI